MASAVSSETGRVREDRLSDAFDCANFNMVAP